MSSVRLILALLLLSLPGRSGPVTASAQEGWMPESWLSTRTASVQVFYPANAQVSRLDLRELELAVQELAVRLELGPAALRSLRADPIRYLYAQDATGLRWFGIDAVDGLAMVGERKVLATRIPHRHELVHVLAFIAIEPAPSGNQPWLQEGLASYLGGHLGEAPAAVLASGDHVFAQNPGVFPRLFAVDAFRSATIGAEAAYAASARLVQYLDEVHGGMGPLLVLSRLLAGDEAEVALRPAAVVATQLEGVYGRPFAALLADFEEWRRAHPVSGIVPAARPVRAPDWSIADRDHEIEGWVGPEGWILSARPLRGDVDFSLGWAAEPLADGVWSAPPARTGLELRLGPDGGRLLDHGGPLVLLRWFGDFTADDGSLVWFMPAHALGPVVAPAADARITLWSQPRFEVD